MQQEFHEALLRLQKFIFDFSLNLKIFSTCLGKTSYFQTFFKNTLVAYEYLTGYTFSNLFLAHLFMANRREYCFLNVKTACTNEINRFIFMPQDAMLFVSNKMEPCMFVFFMLKFRMANFQIIISRYFKCCIYLYFSHLPPNPIWMKIIPHSSLNLKTYVVVLRITQTRHTIFSIMK